MITYPTKESGSISFHMPSGDVLKLNEVLFVFGSKKNLLLVSYMTNFQYLVDPTLYRQLIGSIMYLVNIKPNICYAMNTLIRFMVASH
jgi:hypothetical protein